MRTQLRWLTLAATTAVSTVLAATSAQAACTGVTFDAAFAASYTCTDLGNAASVPGPYGGVTFLNNSTLLLGGAANGPSGALYTLGVTRGMDGHITGFSGPATLYGSAPYIDGGLSFGPGGTLFAAGYPVNTLMQFAGGETSPGYTINLSGLGVASSVGALAFTPAGFAGAGSFKLASYNGNVFYDASLVSLGNGYYDVTINSAHNITGGPEGLVYVDGANAGFGVDSLLVAEWAAGRVGVYDLDADGNPVDGTRRDFITGLSGAEGAVIDPLTGDFIFSTFGGGDRVLVVSGFQAPPGAVPEPATWAMLILGFGAAGTMLRSRRRVSWRG